MKLLLSFTRIAFQKVAIYRLDFWSGMIARFVMMYGMYSLWRTLYQQIPNAFGISIEHMSSYGVMGMLLLATVGATRDTRRYIALRVREGRLELDLMKPINFIAHMLARSYGEFIVRFVVAGLISYLVAYVFFQITVPTTFVRAASFMVSLILGCAVSIFLNLMIGLLSIITLDIRSYEWTFDAIFIFASGGAVPLWLFPETAVKILSLLPFQAIYFAPLSIYVGFEQQAILTVLLVQFAWVLTLLLVTLWFWAYLRRRITIQGG